MLDPWCIFASAFLQKSFRLISLVKSTVPKANPNYFIGLRVGYLRRRERMSQTELAKQIGLSRFQLSSIESGRVPMKLYTAWRMAQWLVFHPNFLFLGGDDSQHFPLLHKEDKQRLDNIYSANKEAVFNDVWDAMGGLLLDAELKYRNLKLTVVSTYRHNESVKARLPELLKRLEKATTQRGKKTELAKFMGVSKTRIWQWLSGENEPGGETTLQLLQWVEQQERQK